MQMYVIRVHINMHACVCLCIHMHVYAHQYITCTSWHFSSCEHFRVCERVRRCTCQSMPASRWRGLGLRCVWSMLTIEHTIVIASCVQRFEEERVGTQHLSCVYMFEVGQPGRGRVRSARSREQNLVWGNPEERWCSLCLCLCSALSASVYDTLNKFDDTAADITKSSHTCCFRIKQTHTAAMPRITPTVPNLLPAIPLVNAGFKFLRGPKRAVWTLDDSHLQKQSWPDCCSCFCWPGKRSGAAVALV